MKRYLPVIAAIGIHASPALAALSIASQASATEVQQAAVPTTPDVATATQDSADAKQLINDARRFYLAHDFAAAVAVLKQCFELTRDPNILFNIAQVYRETNDCSSAVDYYRRYLDQAPRGERSADAKKFVADPDPPCEASPLPIEQSSTPAPPVPNSDPTTKVPVAPPSTPPPDAPSPPEAPPARNIWPTVGWISLGVAAVSAGASVYFSWETIRARRDTEQLQESRSFSAREVMDRVDDFKRNRNWAFATGITAGLSASFGVIALTVLAPRKNQRSTASAITILPSGNSLDIRWDF